MTYHRHVDRLLQRSDQLMYAVMRHAKSDWGLNLPDEFRPISTHGLATCQEAAKYLSANKLEPTLIVSSPAKRAQQTVEGLIQVIGEPVHGIQFRNELYMGSKEDLKAIISEFAPLERLMIICHNPLLEQWLVGAENASDFSRTVHRSWFPTSAMAWITTDRVGMKKRSITSMWRPKDSHD